jgi:hypothetical protein
VVKRDGEGRDLLGGFVGATGAVGALGEEKSMHGSKVKNR